MNYLVYVEHAAENLQFYLWHQDYTKRFNAAPTADKNLAPEWTQAMEDDAIVQIQKDQAEHLRKRQPGAEIFIGTDFEKKAVFETTFHESANPFSTPPMSPGSTGDQESVYAFSQVGSTAATHRSQSNDAFASAGVKSPCKSA